MNLLNPRGKHVVLSWSPALFTDPRYLGMQADIAKLAAEIREVLVPTSGGVVHRERAVVLEQQRVALCEQLAELKQTFTVRTEIEY